MCLHQLKHVRESFCEHFCYFLHFPGRNRKPRVSHELRKSYILSSTRYFFNVLFCNKSVSLDASSLKLVSIIFPSLESSYFEWSSTFFSASKSQLGINFRRLAFQSKTFFCFPIEQVEFHGFLSFQTKRIVLKNHQWKQ